MKPKPPARILLIGDAQPLMHGLIEAGYEVVSVPENCDLYVAVEQAEPLAVLLCSDSPSRDTLEHLALLSRKHPQPALLLHEADNPTLNRQALDMGISAYVSAGLSAAALKSLIDVSIRHAEQVYALRRELARKQQSLADRKVVDKAKKVLWKDHGMNEETAYKALKTMAMNSRYSIAEAARKLLASKDIPE